MGRDKVVVPAESKRDRLLVLAALPRRREVAEECQSDVAAVLAGDDRVGRLTPRAERQLRIVDGEDAEHSARLLEACWTDFQSVAGAVENVSDRARIDAVGLERCADRQPGALGTRTTVKVHQSSEP